MTSNEANLGLLAGIALASVVKAANLQREFDMKRENVIQATIDELGRGADPDEIRRLARVTNQAQGGGHAFLLEDVETAISRHRQQTLLASN